MRNILKHGNLVPLKKERKYTCEECGCEFTATSEDVNKNEHGEFIVYCPECRMPVLVNSGCDVVNSIDEQSDTDNEPIKEKSREEKEMARIDEILYGYPFEENPNDREPLINWVESFEAIQLYRERTSLNVLWNSVDELKSSAKKELIDTLDRAKIQENAGNSNEGGHQYIVDNEDGFTYIGYTSSSSSAHINTRVVIWYKDGVYDETRIELNLVIDSDDF